MHNNDEINEAIQHFKLTKKDQQLLVAGATLMTVATAGAMATTTNAHADTVKNNNVKTEQVNKVNNNVNNGWHANSVAQIKQAIQKQGGNVYTIQYGDTLSAIAQAMNINMATLQQINHIANANVIIAGNKIGFSADHQNVQVMNNQGKVIAQAPVHANAPVAPVVNHAIATPVAHTATPDPVVHTTTVNKPVTTTHTEYVPQQVTTTKEVPTQVTTNQTKTVTKNVPVTTTDANGNQTTTMKPETTTETVPVTTTVNKPVTTTTTVNKPVTVTDTTNQPTTTTTTTPSQTPSSSVDNGSSSVANTTTSTTNNSNSNVDNSSSSNANTANSGQLVNGYTPQQSSSNSSSANSSSSTSSSADSSSSQTSQSSSSSSMSNGYQPQNNQNSNSTEPQMSEYVTSGNGFDYQGFINYFNADDSWQCGQEAKKGNYDDDYDVNINLLRADALKAINEIRVNAGVAPVQYNDFLNDLETAHANQMNEHSTCSHDWLNADGSDSYIDYGTKYIQNHNAGNEWYTPLEDASGLGSGVNEQDIIDRLFASWLSDEGHRDMLINPDYKYIGFGWDNGYSAIDGQTPVSDGGQPMGTIVQQGHDSNGSWQISVN